MSSGVKVFFIYDERWGMRAIHFRIHREGVVESRTKYVDVWQEHEEKREEESWNG